MTHPDGSSWRPWRIRLLLGLAVVIAGAVCVIGALTLSRRANEMNAKERDDAGVLTLLPPELHYLIEPVLRCGCRTEWDAFEYLDKATDRQMAELAAIAKRVLNNDHYPLVSKFLDQYPITRYDECVKLYFFFGLLDHAGLKFDRVKGEGE